ncbi:hypothetical protein [Maritalea sp.]|jgi:hypothetical protein|uniref:hypothetical protein n=1 Tax=Maritalea sp. TaxID=2003361 RepID=UPI0039E65AE8
MKKIIVLSLILTATLGGCARNPEVDKLLWWGVDPECKEIYVPNEDGDYVRSCEYD